MCTICSAKDTAKRSIISILPSFMPSGVIKKKVQDKGFGFISVEGSDDVFFHMSACNGQFDGLREGASVQFDLEDSPKGKRAINVTTM